MKKLIIAALICSVLLFTLNSCKKKEVKVEPKPAPVVKKVVEPTPKVEKPKLTAEEIFMKKSIDALNSEGHLKRIYFDFDKYGLKEDMKPILHKNADWLIKHSSVSIVVEGHCDERGTVEYNIALGEKRAEAAKQYLLSLGVATDKVKIISYGKNKPLVKGVSEETHAENRRAEFTITGK